jgi:HK97 family phage portal protein
LAGFFSRFLASRSASTPVLTDGALPAPQTAEVVATEQRSASLENPVVPITGLTAYDAFLGGASFGDSNAGVHIDSETALMISAVYSAINIISETLATLPLDLFKKTAAGKEFAYDHAIYELLVAEPNELQTWFTFMHSLVSSALRHGNGYAYIHRNGAGRPVALEFLENGECSPVYMVIGRTKYLYYYVNGVMTEKRDILHITCLGSNGVVGKSPIALHNEGMGLAKAAEVFMARFYGKGANMSGAFTTDGTLPDKSFDRLHKQLKEKYAGLANSHEILLLEAGLKYQRFSVTPQEAEQLLTRKFQVEEIARIYRVPLHKLQSLEKSTNNNIEQQTEDFKTDCIAPWCERIEQEFKRKLLLPDEKRTHLFNFNMDYLMRATPTARSTYYTNRFATGSITSNEIRTREGDNRLENPLMDVPYVQSGFQPLREENWTKALPPATTPPATEKPAEQ